MKKKGKKVSKTAGLVPGALVYVGDKETERIKITVIDYKEDAFQEKPVEKIEDIVLFKDTNTVTWINVDGIHNVGIIEKIGKHFGLHPLILEDILNTSQRPKIEDHGKYIFIAMKMLSYNHTINEMESEHLSLILAENCVISFQEKEGDIFDSVRERIRHAKGRVRTLGCDYLAYSLLDAVIDNYFTVIEGLGEKIEAMEPLLVENPEPKLLQAIHGVKRDTIFLRKSVWPLREVVNFLERADSVLIKENIRIFLRDIYDHTIHVIDSIETFRDTISGMLDIYLSSISNRMNEIMKVLTIIATIFIPITFIAGIYGMNFNPEVSSWNMPELNWRFGYLFAWGLIILVVLSMAAYFRKKKWL